MKLWILLDWEHNTMPYSSRERGIKELEKIIDDCWENGICDFECIIDGEDFIYYHSDTMGDLTLQERILNKPVIED